TKKLEKVWERIGRLKERYPTANKHYTITVVPDAVFWGTHHQYHILPLLILSNRGILEAGDIVYVPHLTSREHWMMLLKTDIVLTSWMFNYFALKHLLLTIVAPVRATGPLWTLMGAIIIFGEQLSVLRWLGLLLTLFFSFVFPQSESWKDFHSETINGCGL
ncbi:MAG: bacterial/archaeal transporter family protein, partial [Anaerophaga sp.]|nr:bacterial/archaeal transporter family protein [Anaerophaga sp.]